MLEEAPRAALGAGRSGALTSSEATSTSAAQAAGEAAAPSTSTLRAASANAASANAGAVGVVWLARGVEAEPLVEDLAHVGAGRGGARLERLEVGERARTELRIHRLKSHDDPCDRWVGVGVEGNRRAARAQGARGERAEAVVEHHGGALELEARGAGGGGRGYRELRGN